jgi:uncharacterized protein
LGFHDVRVRHHELPAPGNKLALARIELGKTEMAKLFQNDAYAQVAAAVKKLGYAHVTLDLQGFRSGGYNEIIGTTPIPKHNMQ